MAFAFAIPAIGSAVLPAIGAIGSGLGGALASGAGALGSALSSIPVIGSTLGGTIGSLGSGLGSGLSALSAGNIGGALSSLGSGAIGAGSNMLGGLGGLYTGADKLVGGMLPNVGGAGITPSQGYLGGLFPAGHNSVGLGSMAGKELPVPGLAPGNQGGFFGMGKGTMMPKVLDAMTQIGDVLGSSGDPGVTQQGVNTLPVNGNQPAGPQLLPAPTSQTRSLNLGPPTSMVPFEMPNYQDELTDDQKMELQLNRPSDSLEAMFGRRATSMTA